MLAPGECLTSQAPADPAPAPTADRPAAPAAAPDQPSPDDPDPPSFLLLLLRALGAIHT
jgi:hypothetical protein